MRQQQLGLGPGDVAGDPLARLDRSRLADDLRPQQQERSHGGEDIQERPPDFRPVRRRERHQQTQDQWMDSHYLASSVAGGLAFPDFVKVAKAYGFRTVNITKNAELPAKLKEVIDCDGPVFCNIEIAAKYRVIPQVKFGRPNEDPEPLLDRKEFFENMIVKPLETSRER